MVSMGCWLPGRHLSAISVVLVGLLGIAVSYTLPKEHESDKKEGVYAPLVFPKDEWKFGTPDFLTPQNSSHLNAEKLSQIAQSRTKPSDAPNPPTKPENVFTSSDSSGLNDTDATKNLNVSKEAVSVTGDDKVTDDLKGTSQNYSGSRVSEKILKELDTPLKGNATPVLVKIKGEKQSETTSSQISTNVKDETTKTAENLVSSSVTETTQKASTVFKIASGESHWNHDHLSGKGGPVPFMHSPDVALLMSAIFVAIALFGYFGLVCWRRALEQKYGNRELLVNEEESSDLGDFKSYEL